MPESEDAQRFDRLLDAMVKKSPLDVADKEPPAPTTARKAAKPETTG